MQNRAFTSPLASQAIPAAGSRYGHAFWERLWRSAGTQSSGLFIVGWLVYSLSPLAAIVLAGLAVLNLMWFAAALRTDLAQVGQEGWGAAATAASVAAGGLLFLLIAMTALRAFPAIGVSSAAPASELDEFAWAIWVISSFPRAMLIMAGSLGLWRARMIPNAGFALCVLAVVLVLAGGSTWISDGAWSPEGVYSRLISPIIGLAWLSVVGWVLLKSRRSFT